MDKYKISIIIPVYNVDKYIKKCLDSIVEQTHKNLEIILIDDGSSDNSGKICDEYSKKNKRIKIFHQKNSGVSVARNKGIDNATGDYIMFVDPDDWIELNACEKLLNKIKKDDLDILVFNFYKEYIHSSEKHKRYKFNDRKTIIEKLQAKILAPSMKIPQFDIQGVGFTWNKIVSAESIRNQKFPFEGKKAIFEDVVFYYNLLEKVKKVEICNEYLYHYRVLNNSATRGYNKDFLDISDEFFKNINNLSKNHKEDIYFKKSLYIRIISNFCTALNVYFNNNNLKLNLFQIKKMIKKELNKNYYKDAIKKTNLKNLSKKLKIYTILLRIKAYFCILLVNKLEKKVKRRMYTYGSNFSNL